MLNEDDVCVSHLLMNMKLLLNEWCPYLFVDVTASICLSIADVAVFDSLYTNSL